MSVLSWTAIAVALAAFVGAFFALPGRWFCGLFSLSCMLGGADAVYRELTAWAFAFLVCGLLFAGAAAHAVYTDARGPGRR